MNEMFSAASMRPGAATMKLGATTLEDPELIADYQNEIRRRAFAGYLKQGNAAFENPKSSTVFHEAGHTVVAAYFNVPIRLVRVWKKKRGEAHGHWMGLTDAGKAWRSDNQSSPEADLEQACHQMAGILSEMLFDRENFRECSSMNEVLTANGLADNAAIKNGKDRRELMLAVLACTGQALQQNEGIVRAIAADLDRHKVVRRKRLAELLAPIDCTPSEAFKFLFPGRVQ